MCRGMTAGGHGLHSAWLALLLHFALTVHGHVQGDDCMAEQVGVGFTDVGSGIPGTDSSQFDSATFQGWGAGFYARLAAHMAAVSESIGYAHLLALMEV